MAELKTKRNTKSVKKFIESVDNEQKQADSFKLLTLFEDVTGLEGCMWGDSIIGFGSYHYSSKRSSQKGNWPLTGFSPRVQQISLYIMSGFQDYTDLLEKLGKYTVSKGCCLYIKKLDDIHIPTLKKIIKRSIKDMKASYETGA